jgi:hypothetical protein
MNDRTIEIYADTRGLGTCRDARCGARLTWAEVVTSGKRMCFTGEPVARQTRHDAAGRLIEALPWDENHWIACPGAQTFRRGSAEHR